MNRHHDQDLDDTHSVTWATTLIVSAIDCLREGGYYLTFTDDSEFDVFAHSLLRGQCAWVEHVLAEHHLDHAETLEAREILDDYEHALAELDGR
jgi:hypothetical protein